MKRVLALSVATLLVGCMVVPAHQPIYYGRVAAPVPSAPPASQPAPLTSENQPVQEVGTAPQAQPPACVGQWAWNGAQWICRPVQVAPYYAPYAYPYAYGYPYPYYGPAIGFGFSFGYRGGYYGGGHGGRGGHR